MTVINAKYVNWYEENLQEFYEDNNNGFVHGIYVYDDMEDFPIAVQWFKTETEARKALLEV